MTSQSCALGRHDDASLSTPPISVSSSSESGSGAFIKTEPLSPGHGFNNNRLSGGGCYNMNEPVRRPCMMASPPAENPAHEDDGGPVVGFDELDTVAEVMEGSVSGSKQPRLDPSSATWET